MSADDKFAAVQARFDSIDREYADRRSLMENRHAQSLAQNKEATAKDMAVFAKKTELARELGKQRKAAGGWGQGPAQPAKSQFQFGVEAEEDQQPQQASPVPPPGKAPPAPAARPRRAPRPVDDYDDDDLSGQSWLR
jgi:hypothetical protein